MKRIKYAIKMFWSALTKPQLFQYGLFKMTESLFVFLKETAEDGRPRTALFGIKNIAEIAYDNEQHKALLTLWCGVNEKDNPLTRLRELAEENAELRKKLAQQSIERSTERHKDAQ